MATSISFQLRFEDDDSIWLYDMHGNQIVSIPQDPSPSEIKMLLHVLKRHAERNKETLENESKKEKGKGFTVDKEAVRETANKVISNVERGLDLLESVFGAPKKG
jgi:hypothetical protein